MSFSVVRFTEKNLLTKETDRDKILKRHHGDESLHIRLHTRFRSTVHPVTRSPAQVGLLLFGRRFSASSRAYPTTTRTKTESDPALRWYHRRPLLDRRSEDVKSGPVYLPRRPTESREISFSRTFATEGLVKDQLVRYFQR